MSITERSCSYTTSNVQGGISCLGGGGFPLLQLEHLLHDLLLFDEERTDDAFAHHLVGQGSAVGAVDRLVLLGQSLVAIFRGPQVRDLRVRVVQSVRASVRIHCVSSFVPEALPSGFPSA